MNFILIKITQVKSIIQAARIKTLAYFFFKPKVAALLALKGNQAASAS